MSGRLPDPSDLLGDRPDDLPGAEDILGPRPADRPPPGFQAGRMLWTGPDADALYSAAEPIGRVLRAFGQGAATAWEGGENLGYSDDVNDALKKAGVYGDVTKGQGGMMRSFNEALIRPAVAGTFGLAGAAMRGIGAGIAGLQAAGLEAGLPRDIVAMPEAFPLFGAETGGLHGVPALPRAEALGQELGRSLSAAEVDHAADLGIIGPAARSSWQDTIYGGPVTATSSEGRAYGTMDSITPTVTARVSGLQEAAKQDAADAPAGAAPPDPPPAPMDIHEAARAIAPETFAVYDPLSRQVDLLRERLARSKAEQQAAVEASAPHQAEIADLRGRLDDPGTTPRLAKKYQARLDDLEPQRDAFLADQDHIAELMRDTPEQQSLRRLLLETDYQMRDLAPEVTAAYREAAKRFPESQVEAAASAAEPAAPAVAAESAAAAAGEMPGTAEPVGVGAAEPVTGTRAATTEAAAPSPPIEPTSLSSEATEGAAGAEPSLLPVEATPAAGSEGAERTTPTPINIREDVAAKQTDVPQDIRRTVAAKLMAAGRPEEEARAAAELVAAGYETRAARFGGARGTGAELYAAEAPDVVAGRVGSRTPAMELAQRRARTLQQAFRPRFAVQWTRDLDSRKAGTLSRGSDLALGPAPEALKAAGLPDLPLVLKQGEARKIVLEKHAGTIDEETLRRLPDGLRDPILVFRQANGRLGVLLNDGRGSDVLAVVQPDTVVGNRRVNTLVTVHTKSSPISIMEAIRDGRVTYRDEGRSQNWFDQAPDQSRGREPNPGFSGLITTKEDLVKRLGSTYCQTTRGKININNAGSVITLMRDANASTFMHETGHDWLEKLLADAKHPAAPDQIVADSKTVRTWLGAEPDAEITRAQHEKFARGFERYLMEGIAPSRGLERVFAQFKQWLTKIYQTVTRLRAPINDDIRAVFDRMLATPEERAVIASDRVLSGPALGGRELSGSGEPNSPYLKPGKEPTRLVAFLRRKTVENPGTIHEMTVPGGLRDPGGDIRAMIGGSKGMPGLINNATGRTIHDALIRAWEHGYFPEHGEHWGLEDNDLLRKGIAQAAHDEALSVVLMKRPAYGTGQQKLDSIVNNSLPLKLAMPFMQVGMNILDEGLIKNTPLALASPTVRDERRTLRPAGGVARVAQRAVGWLG